jgi:hypothetical protein
VAEAVANGKYFVCNQAVIDKATPYIRDRCIKFHGMLTTDVIGSKFTRGP